MDEQHQRKLKKIFTNPSANDGTVKDCTLYPLFSMYLSLKR